MYCTVSYNSSHCTLLYIYVCKHIYTHIPRAHTYVISIMSRESTSRTISGMLDAKRNKKKKEKKICHNCTRVCPKFFRSSHSPSCCVYSRVYVCALMPLMCDRDFNIVLARGTTKSDETRTACADSRDRRDVVGLECVFFCACTLTGFVKESASICNNNA